jgi:hypothetical protein
LLIVNTDILYLDDQFLFKNVFDDLPALAAWAPKLQDKLKYFLSTDLEYVQDILLLLWWFERQYIYPWLSEWLWIFCQFLVDVIFSCIIFISDVFCYY